MHVDNMNKKAIKIISILFVLIMLMTLLTACNAQTYKHRLEDKGYIVYYIEIDQDSIKELGSLGAQLRRYGLSVDDVKWVIVGAYQSSQNEGQITIYHFKNKASANTFYTKYKEEIVEIDIVIEIDKQDVFYGNEKGINDARNK